MRWLLGTGIAALLAWDLGGTLWFYAAWRERAAARVALQRATAGVPVKRATVGADLGRSIPVDLQRAMARIGGGALPASVESPAMPRLGNRNAAP